MFLKVVVFAFLLSINILIIKANNAEVEEQIFGLAGRIIFFIKFNLGQFQIYLLGNA